jgi:outer membrane protein assembly factor BamB
MGVGLVVAGCGGAADDAVVTQPATTPPETIDIHVVDGDRHTPVAGAAVVARRRGVVLARVIADAQGHARVPMIARIVEASAPGTSRARAAVRSQSAEIALYQRDLQSPGYGGGPSRTRSVSAVTAGPPAGPPAWTFASRTLIEFPPAVDGGLVVVGVNSGRVYGLNADTGRIIWARRQKGAIASSPAIDADRVYVSSMDGALTAYTRAHGTPVWRFSTAGSPVESSPLAVGGRVYVGAWNGLLYAIDAETGRVVWSHRASGEIKGGAALAGDLVIVGDYSGAVTALDARTGTVRWTRHGGRRFYGGPAVSDGVVVIGDVGGAVVALDAGSGAELWRRGTGAYVYSSPAIDAGTVFIGSYSGAFEALDLATGAVRWSFAAGGRISGSATVVDGIVYTAVLPRPGERQRTFGLDVRTGAVRYRGDDGRYSPAVGAGTTLYLVGTRHLYAHPTRTS